MGNVRYVWAKCSALGQVPLVYPNLAKFVPLGAIGSPSHSRIRKPYLVAFLKFRHVIFGWEILK